MKRDEADILMKTYLCGFFVSLANSASFPIFSLILLKGENGGKKKIDFREIRKVLKNLRLKRVFFE